MAKFKLAASAISFGGTTLTCLTDVTISSSASAIEIECAGAAAVEKLAGLPSHTLSINGALETTDTAILQAVQVNDTGAVTADIAGTATGTIDVSSTNGTVVSREISASANGFATYSVTIELDDLTDAANA